MRSNPWRFSEGAGAAYVPSKAPGSVIHPMALPIQIHDGELMQRETTGLGRPATTEARWPVALAIIAVLALLLFLPARVRLLPPWVICLVGAIVIAPLLAIAMRPQSAAWPRIERLVTIAFVVIAGTGNLVVLRELIFDMIRRSQTIDGLQLLSSSIAVWACNVMMFSLLYWQLDRGGPSLRASASPLRPDWIFPSDQAPPEFLTVGWRPQFVDYLFLGFSTATAFSTTDALPLTGRAKFAMMVESSISLLTLVVVGARAINILGA